jgi:hypothetical protein
MAAPTQGPWIAYRSERFAEWIVNQNGGPGYVCNVPWFEHRAAECDANAHMVAAAWGMHAALMAYRSAQRRMLERWSEGDENVKRDLWRALHACEAAANEAIDAAESA